MHSNKTVNLSKNIDSMNNYPIGRADSIRLDNLSVKSQNGMEYYDHYELKAVISGSLIEIFQYQYPVALNAVPSKRKGTFSRHEEYMIRGRNRAFMKLQRKIYANFKKYDKFITLTFDPKQFPQANDYDFALKKFNLLRIQMKKYMKEDLLKFIAVPEFQKNGNVHFHLICNLPYILKAQIDSWWQYGFVDIRAIESVAQSSRYIAKYIGKSFDEKKLLNRKRYLCSNYLDKSKIIYNEGAIALLSQIRALEISSFRSSTYSSEWNGKVDYESYIIDDPRIANFLNVYNNVD
jgi:hypothetical protein